MSSPRPTLVRESGVDQEVDLSIPVKIKSGLPRSLEVIIALIALVLCAPLLGLAAAAIFLSSRGPVLFRQTRIGQGGRLFTLYKIRTMRTSSDQRTQFTAADDSRILPLGHWLRKTKIDELPELWNVFKGDMSLVGPRPEVEQYVDQSNPAWQLILKARPGITDPMTLQLRSEDRLLASVKHNRESFYTEVLQPLKLRGYVEYLQSRSWHGDLKVLQQTAVAVLFPACIRTLKIDGPSNEGS
jgi:lipopolysaccharide/colanic/teichoic acid biosynthesis glycosyltransferase